MAPSRLELNEFVAGSKTKALRERGAVVATDDQDPPAGSGVGGGAGAAASHVANRLKAWAAGSKTSALYKRVAAVDTPGHQKPGRREAVQPRREQGGPHIPDRP